MRALICIREKDYQWAQTAFPASHPGMVRICNKPLLEYLIDFVILNGCTQVRLILDEPGQDIEHYFGTGSRWGIELSYSNSRPSDTTDTILQKNEKFCGENPLLILIGFFFIHYDKEKDYSTWQETSYTGKMSICSTGNVLFVRNSADIKNISSAQTDVEFALSPLESIEDIFQISMQVIASEQNYYVLPGYSADKGIILGRNVEIGKDVVINSPVIIGDNVRLLGEAIIGPSAVIDRNVIIDSGTQVERSAVLEGTYLGRNLYVHEKIVSGKTIFSGVNAESMTSEDAFLLSAIEPTKPWKKVRRILSSCTALLLVIVLYIPYLCLGLIRKLNKDWQKVPKIYYTSHTGETVQLNTITSNSTTLSGRLFSAFYLDRVPLLPQVIQGKIQLIGNHLLQENEQNQQLLINFPEYAPGIFSYTEADNIAPGSIESEVAERFYAAHRSIFQDYKMFARILLSGPHRKRPEA